jgi:hypothetical protein
VAQCCENTKQSQIGAKELSFPPNAHGLGRFGGWRFVAWWPDGGKHGRQDGVGAARARKARSRRGTRREGSHGHGAGEAQARRARRRRGTGATANHPDANQLVYLTNRAHPGTWAGVYWAPKFYGPPLDMGLTQTTGEPGSKSCRSSPRQ